MRFTGPPSRFSLRCCHSGTAIQASGTVAGIYGIRRLQVKRSGRLGARAVLALDCCLPQGTYSGVVPKVRAVSSVGSQYVINEKSTTSLDVRDNIMILEMRLQARDRVGYLHWQIRKDEKVAVLNGVRDACPRGLSAGPTGGETFLYENTPSSYDDRVSYKKVAVTYSPTWWGSTIGDGELNFSVRNGKRWILTAITATVCF